MGVTKQLWQRIRTSLRYRLSLCADILRLKFFRNVFVFGTPFHSNMGDQAQSYCIQKWAKKNYPGYRIRMYDTMELADVGYELLRKIRKYCNKSDKVFLHSGYHTTDLYILEERMQRKVLQLFDDRQVVILPQTIHYESVEEAEKSRKIYNSHNNVVFMCRDEVSYEKAQELFPKCNRMLMPDIVTSMIGTKYYKKNRQGILLCLRNDKEAFYTPEQIAQLKAQLSKIDTVNVTDTTITMSPCEVKKNRKKVLEGIWEEYAGYRVIITDRYHGTIFSLIANTPVIVLSSTDHKLSSGVKWFPDSFREYVRYISELDAVEAAVNQVYATQYSYKLEPYFKVNYYASLRKRIEGK